MWPSIAFSSSSRVGGRADVQLGVQSVELEHVVVERARTCAGSEVCALRAASVMPGPFVVPSGKYARAQTFRQTLRRARDVERRPVQRIDRHPSRVEFSMSWKITAYVCSSAGAVVSLVPRFQWNSNVGRLVLAAARVLHRNFAAIRPCRQTSRSRAGRAGPPYRHRRLYPHRRRQAVAPSMPNRRRARALRREYLAS